MQQRGTCLSLEDALVPGSQCPIWTRDAFEFPAAVVLLAARAECTSVDAFTSVLLGQLLNLEKGEGSLADQSSVWHGEETRPWYFTISVCSHLAHLLSVCPGVADDEFFRAHIINILMDAAAGAPPPESAPFAACGMSFASSLGQPKTPHGTHR